MENQSKVYDLEFTHSLDDRKVYIVIHLQIIIVRENYCLSGWAFLFSPFLFLVNYI